MREHFEAECNTVTGQEMNALSPVLAFAAKAVHSQAQTGLHPPDCLGQ